VAYDVGGLLPLDGRLSVEVNTDTVRLRAADLSLWGGRLRLGVHVGFEVLFAGLLMDYYRLGVRDASRGFNASYAEGGASAKLHFAPYQTLELVVDVRKWFFSRGQADQAFELPAAAWVAEPRLRYTLWHVQADRSLAERHRLFPRIHGVAAGLVLGLDARSSVRDWGARTTPSFEPPDRRNEPRQTSWLLQQWLRAGYRLHDRLRLQLAQTAFFATGVDDLSRARVGGLNPYVVPLAGAPWAAFLADKVVAVQGSAHVRLFGKAEVGVLGDLVWLDDLERTGSSDAGLMAGVGLFADLRLGAFQIDLRAGWTPTVDWQASRGQFGIFGALGWQWSRLSRPATPRRR